MGKDIGIDLGTASVLVYVKGRGIVLREPSVISIDKNTNEILQFGKDAQDMLGRTPKNIVAMRPLRNGVISEYEITSSMIQHFIKKACGPVILKPRVIICVPSEISEVEERAVLDAATQAGAKRTYLIEEPIAAALGAGIDISGPNGRMIVDIGGGTTDIAVLSLGGVVTSLSIKVAGDKFDDAIIRYVRRKYNVLIGEQTAEWVKIKIGSAWARKEPREINVKGRSLSKGLPMSVKLSSAEMMVALEKPIIAIIEAIRSVIEQTPPELVGDILNNGIVMTGGGSLLYGLDYLIAQTTKIKTRVARDPISCVVLGTGRLLNNMGTIPAGVTNLTRRFPEKFT